MITSKFISGFASGAISSMIASGIGKLGPKTDANGNIIKEGVLSASDTKAMMIVGGGLSGGISSSKAGGDFWKGMQQGLITSGLNHAMHEATSGWDDNGYNRKGERINNEGGNVTDYLYDDGKIISSTAVKNTFEPVGAASSVPRNEYGIRRVKLASGAVNDDSLSFVMNIMAIGQVAKGVKLIGMGVQTISKRLVGERVALGASEKTLKSSVYYKQLFTKKGFNSNININVGFTTIKTLPTILGKASNWHTFYGRNATLFGTARVYGGSNYLYYENKGK